MTTLLIADIRNGAMSETTRSAAACALEVGGPVHALALGDSAYAIAAVSRLDGVEKVLHAAEVGESCTDETLASLVLSIAEDYDAIVGSASSLCKSALPRVAAMLDVMQISEVTRVLGHKRFERPVYAGNAIQVVESKDAKLVITARTSAFPRVIDGERGAPIEALAWSDPSPLSLFKEEIASQSTRPDLSSAKIVISGGRGLQSSENFDRFIGPVADVLGAAIGASRAAVDAGYAPNDLQVGQTGKIVAPDLYLAVGISGAIQHLAGMKDSKVIVAINKDEEAPIFQVADFGLVADLFKALPELKEELSKKVSPLAAKHS
ncbi:MAG: electron transfer flavoprotein subunit alpha/FixB family protein [Beijerinckiaceae bacterium]|jgi:electron transfer flavoprotein alpha subunit